MNDEQFADDLKNSKSRSTKTRIETKLLIFV